MDFQPQLQYLPFTVVIFTFLIEIKSIRLKIEYLAKVTFLYCVNYVITNGCNRENYHIDQSANLLM